MTTLFVIIHVIVCIALIMIVLLQTGKGADMGAAFGGGGSNTLFGASGASTFLSKATTAAAVIFMLTSLILAYKAGNRTSGSIISDVPAAVEAPADTGSTDDSAPSSTKAVTGEETGAADADAQPASDATGQTNDTSTNP